ncbi:MAG: glucuronate isomerase [Gammaproteobacteria bacterium]|nr:glucuronate isomerase [Gammaproteobacteria bacterium]
MKEFLGKDFTLETETAQILYDNYAKKMPIFDYHCHLVPKDILEDRKFKDITEVWLVDGHYGDHYKWRSERANGVSEEYITGSKTNKEKFMKWAETVPYTIGNPLYIWTHLELRRYFGITKLLSPETAEEIWNECNKKLETLTARKMIEMNNVKVICTTDDPIDSLEYHLKMKEDKTLKFKVLPAFRPDKAINFEYAEFTDWLAKLEARVSKKIDNLDTFLEVLSDRINFFHEVGARVSDHALDEVMYVEATKEEVAEIFKKRLNGECLSREEVEKYHGFLLVFFGKEYAKHGWVQQYHISAKRNNNSRTMRELGPDTGFDSINDGNFVNKLSKIMDKLDSTNELPKTILYSLNPRDNVTIATLCNCFNDGKTRGKIQIGSAWWFNDQRRGMEEQMKTLCDMGLISNFVGMLTDSRSFLSYPRHEYFRRILCNVLGHLIENGEYPNDIEFVGKIVENVCFNNAVEYFGIDEK